MCEALPDIPVCFVRDDEGLLGRWHPSLVDKAGSKVESGGREVDGGHYHGGQEHAGKRGTLADLGGRETA